MCKRPFKILMSMKTLVKISFSARRGYLYAEVFQQSESGVDSLRYRF